MAVNNINTAMLSECERQGLNGNCGLACPVFVMGECDEPDFTNKIEDDTTKDDYDRAMGVI